LSTLFRKKIKKSFLEKRVDIPGKVCYYYHARRGKPPRERK
jgi:hypothetical protein